MSEDVRLVLASIGQMREVDRALLAFLSRFEGTTRQAYEYHLKRWLQWCGQYGLDVMRVERVHIELRIRELSEIQGLKASTIQTYIGPVLGFYREAARDGIIPNDPGAHVRLPKVHYGQKAALEREELRALRRAGKELGGRHWALSELLIVHALRISETCGIQVENFQEVDRGHRVLSFRRKGGRIERVPLPVLTLMALEDAAGERTSGAVITTRQGGVLSRSGATGLVQTVSRHAAIGRHVNPHLIRSSVITHALDEGMSIRDAQWLAGHMDPRTTTRHYDLGRQNHDRHPAHIMSARLTSY